MSDFEDRLGRALGEGAEGAPGITGLAEAARRRARVRGRRRRSLLAAAAVLVLVGPVAVLSQRGDAPRGDATAATAGPGWKTVAVEREVSRRDAPDVTVLVDVPDSWVALPGSEDECGFYDFGAPSESCSQVEVVSVVTDVGNLDYAFGPGLRPASDYDYPVRAAWIGHVGLGGVDVSVSSDDYQVAARVLASARLEGQEVPDLSAGIYVVGSDGVERPALPLDAAGGYGERIEARGRRDEYAFAEQIDDAHWRAVATVGDKRIVVVAPTPALAELIAGSARVQQRGGQGAWQTVTYEGDPVNESGDNAVLIDVPAGWEPAGGPGCSVEVVTYADPALGCDDGPVVRVAAEASTRYGGPGLTDGGESSNGSVVTGRYVVSADGADYETIRRILASVRAPGESAPSATWRTEDVSAALVELPDDGSVEVRIQLYRGSALDVAASRRGSGSWQAQVIVTPGTRVLIDAPTHALADVVASTVRPTTTADGWSSFTYDGRDSDGLGNAVTFQAPSDWVRLDSDRCRIGYPRFGPPDSDPCEDASALTFFDAETYGMDLQGFSTPEASAGDALVGDLVAYVDAPDHETAVRILDSLQVVD
ncbi:hypothetical protein [Nocardioides sp.]|uniref:hypothetical protein n=1 Tax=Nocardioides sp. TaxID=35761 RepID=UPI003219938B